MPLQKNVRFLMLGEDGVFENRLEFPESSSLGYVGSRLPIAKTEQTIVSSPNLWMNERLE
jgi:hypothetical protein